MSNKREDELAGSNLSTFNEQSAQEHKCNDNSELNRLDARCDLKGSESV